MSFREKFLGQVGNFKKEIIKIDDIGDVEIREITVGQRSMVYKAAMTMKGSGANAKTETDIGLLHAWAVICSAHDVKTGEPVFDKADLETLIKMPTTAMDKLAKPAMKFLGEDPDEEVKN